MNNQRKGILLATTTALLWAVLAIALKVALNHFDPYTIVWFRFLVASLCLILYFSITKPHYLRIYRRPPLMMLAAAVCLAGNYIGYMQGVHLAGPAATQVIIQLGPVLLGLVGFIFFRESITQLRGLGFALAAIGFILFYTYQLGEQNIERSAFAKGVGWIVFAALSWTSYAIFNKKLVNTWPSPQINLIVFGLPVLLFLPLAEFSSLTAQHPWWVWVLMVALGLNTVVAYGTLSASFKYTEANRISIIITMNPVITFILLEIMVALHISWFDIRPVPLMAYLGALMVLGGAVLAVGIKRKR